MKLELLPLPLFFVFAAAGFICDKNDPDCRADCSIECSGSPDTGCAERCEKREGCDGKANEYGNGGDGP